MQQYQHQHTSVPVARLLLAARELLERRQQWADMRTRLLVHVPRDQLVLGATPPAAVTE